MKKRRSGGVRAQVGGALQRLRALVFDGGGMTQSDMIEQAETRVELLVDGFERDAEAQLQTLEKEAGRLANMDLLQRTLELDALRAIARDLRNRAMAHEYDLLEALASSALSWIDDQPMHPRLDRALAAHVQAARTIIAARKRGTRAAEKQALMDGLATVLQSAGRLA